MTVGAVVREPVDLARSPQAQPGTIFEADETRIVLEPTFWAEHGSGAANYGIGVSLDVPAADLDAVTGAMAEVGGDQALVNTTGSEDLVKVEPVGDAIDLESNVVLASAAVVLIFGLVLLGSALGPGGGRDRRGPRHADSPRPHIPPAGGRPALARRPGHRSRHRARRSGGRCRVVTVPRRPGP